MLHKGGSESVGQFRGTSARTYMDKFRQTALKTKWIQCFLLQLSHVTTCGKYPAIEKYFWDLLMNQVIKSSALSKTTVETTMWINSLDALSVFLLEGSYFLPKRVSDILSAAHLSHLNWSFFRSAIFFARYAAWVRTHHKWHHFWVKNNIMESVIYLLEQCMLTVNKLGNSTK